MKILIPRWYHPYDDGWKICSYQTKGAGYDSLSHELHAFKENNKTAVGAWTKWSIDTLTAPLEKIPVDYCIRSLGRSETAAEKGRPLHTLAQKISNHFGLEYVPELLSKKRKTRHLVDVGGKPQREEELKGVFCLNELEIDLAKKSVLVVDDIRTSGVTSTFIAKLLRKHFKDIKCYLFVLAESNSCGGNSQDVIDKYQYYSKKSK